MAAVLPRPSVHVPAFVLAQFVEPRGDRRRFMAQLGARKAAILRVENALPRSTNG
jgi:hypothetical protein